MHYFDSGKATYLGKEYGIPSRALGICRQDCGTEMSRRRLSSARHKVVERQQAIVRSCYWLGKYMKCHSGVFILKLGLV